MADKLRVGVLASGGGTTYQALREHINEGRLTDTEIAFVVCNNGPKNAEVWQRAQRLGDEIVHISNKTQETCSVPIVDGEPVKGTISFEASEAIAKLADDRGADLLVGLGFMRMVIGKVLEEKDIANWHPGPLPVTAGKYGDGVHEEVMRLGLRFSGPTSHWMDKEIDENYMPMYDTGPQIGHVPVLVTEAMRQEYSQHGTAVLLRNNVMDIEKQNTGLWIAKAGSQLAA